MTRADVWRCVTVLITAMFCRHAFNVIEASGSNEVSAVRTQTAAKSLPFRVKLLWPKTDETDIVISAATCPGRVYLLTTPRVSAIEVFDAYTGRYAAKYGTVGEDESRLRDAVGIVADCAKRVLYAVQSTHSLVTYSLDDGRYLRSFAKPDFFVPSAPAQPILSIDGSTLYVPGLWPHERLGYMKNPKSSLYEGVMLGWELSLRDERSSPFVMPSAKKCNAGQSACRRIAMDRLTINGSWAVAEPGSAKVAIYDSQKRVARLIDGASPLFRSDGSALASSDSLEREMAWNQANSVIMSVATAGELVGIVHSHVTGAWTRGQTAQFETFLNVVSSTGRMTHQDIPLPGLPVGRDGTSFLVIDYGPAGRRNSFQDVDLVRIPFATN